MYGFVFVTSENAPLIFSARVIQKVIDCWPTDVTVSFEKRTKKKINKFGHLKSNQIEFAWSCWKEKKDESQTTIDDG